MQQECQHVLSTGCVFVCLTGGLARWNWSFPPGTEEQGWETPRSAPRRRRRVSEALNLVSALACVRRFQLQFTRSLCLGLPLITQVLAVLSTFNSVPELQWRHGSRRLSQQEVLLHLLALADGAAHRSVGLSSPRRKPFGFLCFSGVAMLRDSSETSPCLLPMKSCLFLKVEAQLI